MSVPVIPKSCLLVIPRHFYSFEKLIKGTLEKKGYEVIVSNDEYPSDNFGKILGKLHIPVLLPITERVVYRDYLENKHYDLILIFKGRGIGRSLIQKMMNSATRVIGYNWDSFKYNKAPLRWYKYSTKYCTFDYRDAENFNLPLVELFSSINPDNIENAERNVQYEISAIIRNHSGRLRYLDKSLNILNKKNVFIYIYEQNIFFMLINFFRNPFLYLKYKNNIFFKPLSYRDYVDVLNKSEFTIDYAHPDQSGLTMRCFEALSTGTKIITNNPFINKFDHFNESNSVLFIENETTPQELKDSYESCKGKPTLLENRTISDFIGELIA